MNDLPLKELQAFILRAKACINTLANYLSLYSGNAPLTSRPMLVIE